jgi:hypothetical protein
MFQEIILFLISSLSLGTWCAAPEAPEATTATHGQPNDVQPRLHRGWPEADQRMRQRLILLWKLGEETRYYRVSVSSP